MEGALGAPGDCVMLHIGVGTGNPLTNNFFFSCWFEQSSAFIFLWFCEGCTMTVFLVDVVMCSFFFVWLV